MTLTSNLAAYQDVERALRIALLNELGCVQPMPGETPEVRRRKAQRWRQRAYHYRELVRRENERAYRGTTKEALAGKSDFDALVIRIREDGNVSIVNEMELMPAPIGLSGVSLPPEPKLDPTREELPAKAELPDFALALRMARQEGLDL